MDQLSKAKQTNPLLRDQGRKDGGRTENNYPTVKMTTLTCHPCLALHSVGQPTNYSLHHYYSLQSRQPQRQLLRLTALCCAGLVFHLNGFIESLSESLNLILDTDIGHPDQIMKTGRKSIIIVKPNQGDNAYDLDLKCDQLGSLYSPNIRIRHTLQKHKNTSTIYQFKPERKPKAYTYKSSRNQW